MWLFDNLFLDKNTPMAINIADPLQSENLQGVPTGAIAPSGVTWWGSGTTGTTGAGATGDGANPPTQPVTMLWWTSFPLSGSPWTSTTLPWISMIWNTLNSGDFGGSRGGDVSFDIGGDLSFSDAPSDMAISSIPWDATASMAHPLGTTSDQPAFILSEVPLPMSDLSIITPPESVWSPIILPTDEVIVTSAPSEIPPLPTVSTESPLMNLMSGFDTSWTAPETPITNSTDMPVPTPVTDTPSTDGLFSLMDTSVPSTPEVIVLTPIEVVDPIMTILPEDQKSADIIVTPMGNVTSEEAVSESIWETPTDDHPMNTIGKELARMTRSPRLQGKLNGFIGELEELSLEEERIKWEKRKQISSYQNRIAELKTEYETRIHALELEEDDLKKQIIVMDEEREHITQVIHGFKQELEVV